MATTEFFSAVRKERTRNVINKAVVEKKSIMQKTHIANSDKPIDLYNLDTIISITYNVKY